MTFRHRPQVKPRKGVNYVPNVLPGGVNCFPWRAVFHGDELYRKAAYWTDAELAAGGGRVTYAADTTNECFVRLQVADSAGTVVAMSNPVWMLHNAPPNGIPAPRQA